jgi:hypothetical protein
VKANTHCEFCRNGERCTVKPGRIRPRHFPPGNAGTVKYSACLTQSVGAANETECVTFHSPLWCEVSRKGHTWVRHGDGVLDCIALCGSEPLTFATGQDLTIGLDTARQDEVTTRRQNVNLGSLEGSRSTIGPTLPAWYRRQRETGRMPNAVLC